MCLYGPPAVEAKRGDEDLVGFDESLEKEFQRLEGRPELTPPECEGENTNLDKSGAELALGTINRILMHDMGRIRGGMSKAYNDLQENHPEIVEELRNAKD